MYLSSKCYVGKIANDHLNCWTIIADNLALAGVATDLPFKKK